MAEIVLLFEFDFNGSVFIFFPLRQSRISLAHNFVGYGVWFDEAEFSFLFFALHDRLNLLFFWKIILLLRLRFGIDRDSFKCGGDLLFVDYFLFAL